MNKLKNKKQITKLAEKILALPAVTKIFELILGKIWIHKKYKLDEKLIIVDKRNNEPKLNFRKYL